MDNFIIGWLVDGDWKFFVVCDFYGCFDFEVCYWVLFWYVDLCFGLVIFFDFDFCVYCLWGGGFKSFIFGFGNG